MPRIVPTEHHEQVMLFKWAALQPLKHPELQDLFAIPNFSGRIGKLTMLQSVKLSREGRRKGIPDICLPHARNGFNSLYIELKRIKGGSVKPEQKDWHQRLSAAGHKVVVCKGWEAASEEIIKYLKGDR